MSVHFEAVDRYDLGEIEKGLETALTRLGFGMDGARSAFLKPNIVRPGDPSTAMVTHPTVIEALIKILRQRGVTEIAVGEASSVGVDVEEAFRVSGYRSLCDRLGVPLLNLNEVERRDLKWMYGRLPLPRVALDSDLYINCAKMKTHFHTTVTLGVKNQKGLLLPEDKQFDHLEVRLHPALSEYARLARPALTLVDGIVGMDGEGPTKGKPKKSGVLVLGDDIFETDYACARFMGQDPRAIRHLAYALERGHFTDPQAVTGEAYTSRKTDFELPDTEPKKLLNFYGWKNDRACAECEHVVENAFKLGISNPRYWFTFIPKVARLMLFERIDLLRGRDARIPKDHGHLLMVGDCTERLAMEYGVSHVPGCVPRPADVIKRIQQM